MKKPKIKRFQTWCPGCDAYVLENGKKCPVCGSKWEKKSKNKKYPLGEQETDWEVRYEIYTKL